MKQIILACDDQGHFLEYIPKSVGHTGQGRRHLAITVVIYNSKGKLLLQKRKHQIFDNLWDLGASTHPLHREDGTDETKIEAALRALKEEFNIENVSLEEVGSFNYFARFRKYCENEHDTLLVGKYNGEVKLNLKVGYQFKWMDKKDFLKDFEQNPNQYTAWTTGATKMLKDKSLFDY